MEDRVIRALLEQARYYGLLSKRAARAAKRASGAQREILEERAQKLLAVSQDYFQRAEALSLRDANAKKRKGAQDGEGR
jgi:hypothetical protein